MPDAFRVSKYCLKKLHHWDIGFWSHYTHILTKRRKDFTHACFYTRIYLNLKHICFQKKLYIKIILRLQNTHLEYNDL